MVEIWLSIELTSLHLLRKRAERAAKSEKKSRKKAKKWREIKKKLIKKGTVYQLREFSTVLGKEYGGEFIYGNTQSRRRFKTD